MNSSVLLRHWIVILRFQTPVLLVLGFPMRVVRVWTEREVVRGLDNLFEQRAWSCREAEVMQIDKGKQTQKRCYKGEVVMAMYLNMTMMEGTTGYPFN